ncbi:MAG: PAS domain-containing protein, partial [Lysobacter sp.]
MRRSWTRLEVVPGTAAGFAVLVAGLVLVGWAFGIEPLKRILPGRVAMNPMTAVAFLFAGVSLWLRRSAEPTPPSLHRRGLARLTAAIVIGIGGLKLAAVTLGWHVGVDGWLFADRLASGDSALASRMPPNAALNFVLLGLALLTLDVTTRRARRPAEVLASGTFLIALVAIAGYAYGVPEFSGVANFVPMALHTAVVFAVLAFGIFAARPHAGMMAVITGPSLGGVMARRLLPATVFALLALGWLRLVGERHGYYGANLGVALYTATIALVIGVLIWWSAKALHVAEAEQRRLAAHQRASDEQVRLLLDSTAEAIYGIDADGFCTFTNRACEALLGYADSKDLLGKDMHELTHHSRVNGTPYPSEHCPIYRSVRTDTPAHVDDEVFWRADGSSVAVEYWSYPLRRGGKPVGAVVTFLDITARKEAET